MPLLEITVYGPLACVRTPNLKEKEKICIKNCFVVTFNLMWGLSRLQKWLDDKGYFIKIIKKKLSPDLNKWLNFQVDKLLILIFFFRKK